MTDPSRPGTKRNDRPLRIVHVYKDYHPVVGGIENHLKLVAEAQADAGHQVSVLVSAAGRRGSKTREAGVEIVRSARIAAPASTPLAPGLALEVLRCSPDIIHLHSPYPPGELAWLLSGKHPAVMTYHSDVVKQRALGRIWAPMQRRVLSKLDRVFATSPRYVDSSPFLRELPKSKLRVLPLGIDLDRYVQAGDAHQALETNERQIGQDDLRIVFVGRLRYYKGLGVLVEALPSLPIGMRLTVVGTGPLGEELRARAIALDVAERIDWLGNVSDADLPGVYASGDLFVLPSVARSEAFGLVLVEAMASGLPCISTELNTGTSWVNQDGVTGAVVPANDPGALAAALIRLSSDPERLSAMGRAARMRAIQEFSATTMFDRMMQHYEEVLL